MFINLGDSRIYYEQRGSGPAVVFIHGLGANCSSWFAQTEALSANFTTVAYDWPGSGHSSKWPAYSVEQWADHAAMLCQELKIDRAGFVGHSLGAAVVIALAARHPTLVASFALLGPVPRLGDAGRKAITDRVAKVRSEGMFPLIDTVPMGALSPETRKNNPAVHALFRAMLLAHDPDSYAAHCEALLRADVLPLAPQVTVPGLFIAGDADPTAPPASVAELAAKFREAGSVIVTNGGHAMHLDQPAAVNQQLAEFFTKTL